MSFQKDMFNNNTILSTPTTFVVDECPPCIKEKSIIDNNDLIQPKKLWPDQDDQSDQVAQTNQVDQILYCSYCHENGHTCDNCCSRDTDDYFALEHELHMKREEEADQYMIWFESLPLEEQESIIEEEEAERRECWTDRYPY